MKKIMTMIIPLSIVTGIHNSMADEFNIELAPVWWQYEESMDKITGFPASPFNSKANGFGLKASSEYYFDVADDIAMGTSINGIFSVNHTDEYWSGPSFFQKNKLSINQYEITVNAEYKPENIGIGAWASYQVNEQKRKEFIVGTRLTTTGSVKETIKTYWFGIESSISLFDEYNFKVYAGTPVSVSVKNSLIAAKGKKRTGYRFGINGSVPLPWEIMEGDSMLTFAYDYRKMGDERISQASYWPRNYYQTVSIGMSIVW